MNRRKTFEALKRLRNRLRPKDERPSCSAVIVAAGSSQRMGSDKLLADLEGEPVLARTLAAFQSSDLVEEIVVVTRTEKIRQIADLCQEHGFTKVSKVISGGKTRMESSLAGVSEVSPSAKLIAIHDGARPLVSQELIARTVMAAHDHLSAVPVIPSTDTLKNVDDRGGITGSADRSHIVRVQTPQVFTADLIKGALTDAVKRELPLTDDCSAMERMGVTTQTVPGDDENIKITTPWDLDVARAILKGRLSKA